MSILTNDLMIGAIMFEFVSWAIFKSEYVKDKVTLEKPIKIQ